jgi:hypothetical protein
MNNVDLTVGKGDVTYTSWITTGISWLTSLLALITTLSGNLPDGLGPEWGVALTVGAGVVGFLIQALHGVVKARFAEAKAAVMAGQGAAGYDVLVDSLDLDPSDVPEIPTDPTDTDTPPPFEPTN